VVPPLHNLAVLNSHDRYEPVVVGCAGSDNLAVHLVFEDHYTSILGSMHDERVRAAQDDVLAVAGIKGHQCFATVNLLWPSGENISKLEDRALGNGIEIMVAIDLTGQTLLDYGEERVERREGLVLGIGHDVRETLCSAATAVAGPTRASAPPSTWSYQPPGLCALIRSAARK